ncbi:MAG TPA: BlaI/MecI/CopY family transcriptional regulator [Terriglobia bacterium]|nr:BlaI/MecI/CopY family transcriptional regulator [Terriglobia bacterium]
MPRKTHNHRLDLPALELECMKALWTLGESTVHGIRAALLATRPLAYTTVMTIMDRLARKGVVEREKRGRAHVYRPAVTDAEVRDRALDRLVGNFFLGSRQRLREFLETPGVTAARPAHAADRAAERDETRPSAEISPAVKAAPVASNARPARTARPEPAEEAIDPSLL